MKTFTVSAMALAGILSGCAESAHEQAMDKEISNLEATCNSLSNSVTSLQEEQDKLLNSITNLMAVGKSVNQINDRPTFVGPPYVDQTTGQPIEINPATGRPFEQPVVVFPANGRVTEANDQWWRWTVWFAIGNPNDKANTGDARIKLLDTTGQVITQVDEDNLNISGDSTNYYVTNTIINLPEAQNVKTVQVDLKDLR